MPEELLIRNVRPAGGEPSGVLIRMAVSQIRAQGRSTQGVTLINLGEGEKLAGMERIEEKDAEGGNGRGTQRGWSSAHPAALRLNQSTVRSTPSSRGTCGR